MIFFTKREQLVILLIIIFVLVISLFSYFKKNIKNQPSVASEETTNNVIDNKEKKLEINGQKDEEPKDNLNSEETFDMIMVHITGEIFKPGLVELENGSRLIDAVNETGGLTDNADLDKINLARKLKDEEKIYIPKIGEKNLDNHDYDSNFSNNNDKININDASKEELVTLPGVGEVLADRIIQYREKNKFSSIEEIQNVSGIGAKTFEEIKELIKVD